MGEIIVTLFGTLIILVLLIIIFYVVVAAIAVGAYGYLTFKEEFYDEFRNTTKRDD